MTHIQWLPVLGFENFYEVSELGEVKSIQSSQRYRPNQKSVTLKQHISKYGYCQVTLTIKGIRTLKRVNRIVAQAFIPNPENKPCVNHINGIKVDNAIGNLEWVTYSENETHSYNELGKNIVGNKKTFKDGINKKAKIVICNETNIPYKSIKFAAISLGLQSSGITMQLNGKIRKTGNLTFRLG